MNTSEILQDLIQKLSKGEQTDSVIQPVTEGLCRRNVKLLDIIESLGPLLLDSEAQKRYRSVDFIARVIESSLKSLNENEIKLLAEFFCAKLKDHHSILPAALRGLNALSGSQNLAAGLTQEILRAVLENVYCQSQVVSDRRVVFQIFKNFLSGHLKEIQSMGQDFVYGFIQAIDQEKDPRNLLIIFSCFPVVATYCDLGAFAEELFEVVSCYFPVDFTPPANDPFGITKEDLVLGLRHCLTCSKIFAPYCLPLLQEKLDSDVISAKVDALETLETCCSVYGPPELETFLSPLWTSLRREIFMSANADEVEHRSLDCLTSLARAFTVNGKIDSSAFIKLLDQIIQECRKHLCEPEHRLMFPSCNVLVALIAGSPHAAGLIVHEAIPTLLDQFNVKTLSSQRQQILSILNKIVNAGLYGFTPESVHESGVIHYMEPLYTVYMSTANSDMENRLKILALQGLANLMPCKLKSDQWPSLCDFLLHNLLEQHDHHLREEMKLLLRSMASSSEALIITKAIPYLLGTLETGVFSISPALDAISALPATRDILFNSVPHLIHVLDKSGSNEIEAAVLQALLTMIQNAETDVVAILLAEMDLMKDLLKIAEKAGFNLENVSATAKILRVLSKNLDTKQAEGLARDLVNRFSSYSFEENPNTVLVLEATLGWLDVQLHIEGLALLISNLQKLAISTPDESLSLSAARLSAALINKAPQGPDLDAALGTLLTSLGSIVEQNPERGSLLFVWTTKGLVMRGYELIDTWVDKLVSYLHVPQVSVYVSRGFGTILEDCEEVLNQESHAVIRLLYRQRFFQQTLPKLLSSHKPGESTENPSHFAALASQLPHLPKTILGSYLSTLLPVLVQCLTPDQPVRLLEATLGAISGLVAESPHFITKFLDTLVPRLLTLASRAESMNVRMLALKCLGSLTCASEPELLPLRFNVVQQLAQCLDDKKRLVRKEAAVARNKWIVLGQPCGK